MVKGAAHGTSSFGACLGESSVTWMDCVLVLRSDLGQGEKTIPVVDL